jgi:hypothetical protein
MTERPGDLSLLRDLLDALCEGTITAAQMKQIEELILSHPEAEAFYVQSMSLEADLARHFAARPDEQAPWQRTQQPQSRSSSAGQSTTSPLAPVRRPPPIRGRRLLMILGAAAAVAAGLLLALLLWHHRPQPPTPGEQAGERSDDTVAVLLRASGAVWGESDVPTRPGAALPPGLLRLTAGVAHLEFYSGATVILEGPADFHLLSASEASCERGKLRATVPPQAQGFTIHCPQLNLVDRGTEFGLLVDGSKRTEVHVFRGKVEWFGTGENTSRPRELTTGKGIRLEGAEAARAIKSDSRAFVSAGDLSDRLRAASKVRQQEWEASVAALRQDPSLELYYSFQAEQSWSRSLRDLSAGHHEPRDGAIVGCTWVGGRWLGKDALEFKRVSDRVRFRLPGEFASITLMAWVRVDSLPHRFNSLMMTDGWLAGAPHWHIGDNGVIALGVQGGRGKGGYNYDSPRVFTPERFGQWTHLAVVYDGDEEQVTHYVNGRAVASEALRFDTPLRIGDAELGNWNLGSRRNEKRPIRYFSGGMDEFLIFSRALTDKEIQQFHTRGRPPL